MPQDDQTPTAGSSMSVEKAGSSNSTTLLRLSTPSVQPEKSPCTSSGSSSAVSFGSILSTPKIRPTRNAAQRKSINAKDVQLQKSLFQSDSEGSSSVEGDSDDSEPIVPERNFKRLLAEKLKAKKVTKKASEGRKNSPGETRKKMSGKRKEADGATGTCRKRRVGSARGGITAEKKKKSKMNGGTAIFVILTKKETCVNVQCVQRMFMMSVWGSKNKMTMFLFVISAIKSIFCTFLIHYLLYGVIRQPVT